MPGCTGTAGNQFIRGNMSDNKNQQDPVYRGLHEIALAITDHSEALNRNADALLRIGRMLEEIGVNMVTPQMGDALRGLASLEFKE
jgi:hypothetical protein